MSNLRDVLQVIHDEHGDLNAVLVVDAARDPEHPLHHRFEWDDTLAGQQWRLAQAGQLLRVTYRPDPTKPTDLRAFVPVKGAESHQSSYTPTETVLADPFLRQILLRSMEREWRGFKKRYEHMAEFAALIQADIQGEAS